MSRFCWSKVVVGFILITLFTSHAQAQMRSRCGGMGQSSGMSQGRSLQSLPSSSGMSQILSTRQAYQQQLMAAQLQAYQLQAYRMQLAQLQAYQLQVALQQAALRQAALQQAAMLQAAQQLPGAGFQLQAAQIRGR